MSWKSPKVIFPPLGLEPGPPSVKCVLNGVHCEVRAGCMLRKWIIFRYNSSSRDHPSQMCVRTLGTETPLPPHPINHATQKCGYAGSRHADAIFTFKHEFWVVGSYGGIRTDRSPWYRYFLTRTGSKLLKSEILGISLLTWYSILNMFILYTDTSFRKAVPVTIYTCTLTF